MDPSPVTTAHAAACCVLGQHAEAAADLERAVALAPALAHVHANLGTVYYWLGAMTRADGCFARAIEIEPGNANIHRAWQTLKSRPYLAPTGLQGTHAPQRQVFMSAIVDLLKDIAPRLDILEVGSYMGASLLTWANAIERLHGGTATMVCIDSWGLGDTAPQYEERMAAALSSSRAHEVFLHNASLVAGRIRVRPVRDLSENALRRLDDRSFDIVYVDGCHHWREARIDISEGRRLVKDGGILCGDDLELQHAECDADNARRHAAEDYITDPRTGDYFHPGVTLAVHDELGRVSSFSGFWAARRAGDRFVDVSLAQAHGVIPPHWPEPLVEQIREYFSQSRELGQLLD